MANRDELKQRKDADTRVALLGLAADRQGAQQGRCLSSSDMAEFLDEKCDTDQRQLYFVHLSTCETCYREWCNLQQELSQGSVKHKKPLLFQRRFLTFSGSLLAVAASVVFYLNLDINPVPLDSSILAVPQFEKKQPPKVLEIPAQQKSAKSNAKQSKFQFEEVQMESVQESVEDELSKSSGQPSFRTRSMAASAIASDPLHRWIQRIQNRCEERSGFTDWQGLVQQGKELSSGGSFSNLESILEKLNQLVAGESREAVCAEIQEIVRENNYE